MKNIFAFTLIVVSTIVMAGSCEAFQGRPDRDGPPGGRGGERDGGPRGGPRGERGGPGGERGERGGPGGERGGPGSMEVPIILALDADKDGKISAEEMSNAATALATLDKNGDGVLEMDEMMPARRERGGRRGGGGPRGGEGGPRGGEGGANGFVERMMENDTDGDGKVSADEAPERMQSFFERLDSDKDGFLTEEEITEASNRWSGGGGGGRERGGDGGGQRPKRPASE